MKTLIYFNRPTCPDNMGVSQLTEDVETFLSERKEIIINPVITDGILTFETNKPVDNTSDSKMEVVTGYALMIETPNDFNN